MASPSFDPSAVTRDDQLARLLAAMAEDAVRGRSPDVEAVAREHPELGDELRELWATAQVADELARRLTLMPRSIICQGNSRRPTCPRFPVSHFSTSGIARSWKNWGAGAWAWSIVQGNLAWGGSWR